MTETTQAEREEARKEILESLRGIKKMRGNATLETVGTITERAFWEIFGLADELRGRIALAEENALRYEGTFDKATNYHRGALVTHRGGLWHCEQNTWDTPGTSSAWKLTAKTPQARGRQS